MERPDHGKPGNALERRQVLRGIVATGAIAGAGGLLSACSSAASSSQAAASPTSTAKRRGGALKVGLTGGSGSDTLDPHKGLTYLDTARAQSLYQPLLQLNTSAQTEFVLAEEISPHGSTSNWVIRLRPGITFHDGKPLTADDVIFTIRRIVSGKLTGATPLGPIDLKGLKALDKHTVQVPMTSPYGSFTDQLAYWYYLYIVPTGFNPAKPNGTGAFKYQSFTPGQRSVFTRNENYWKSGLPYVDSVTIIDFSDSASLQNALTTGVIHGAGALEGPQLAALAADRERADRQVPHRGDHARSPCASTRPRSTTSTSGRRCGCSWTASSSSTRPWTGPGRSGPTSRPRTTRTTTPRCTGSRTSPRPRAC